MQQVWDVTVALLQSLQCSLFKLNEHCFILHHCNAVGVRDLCYEAAHHSSHETT